MPSLKEVKGRIISVTSTQQITKAMKMVAAAKLRKAQDSIIQMRPYSKKLEGIMSNISSANDDTANNPFAQERAIQKVLIIAITSDRGLCGAFNSNIMKATNALIEERYAAQARRGDVEILTIGRKGYEYYTKRGMRVNGSYTGVFTKLSFGNVRLAAEEAMQGFLEKRYDRVDIVYNEFKNVATQIIRREQFLPIQQVDNNASEHGARMTTMDKATENAGELLKQLKLIYNRTRQAAITKEILEIVGGAEALASQ